MKASKKKIPFCLNSRQGFTLTELVALMLILLILAAVSISRYTNANEPDLAAADTLKGHLRYAHLRAMGDTETWSIEIGSNSYTLRRSGNPVNLPGRNNATKTFQATGAISGPTIYFSAGRGIPLDSNGTRVGNDQAINIGSQTITVTQFTGFIP